MNQQAEYMQTTAGTEKQAARAHDFQDLFLSPQQNIVTMTIAWREMSAIAAIFGRYTNEIPHSLQKGITIIMRAGNNL